MAKLSDADVQIIRDKHANGIKNATLAREYNVSPTHIERIIRRISR